MTFYVQAPIFVFREFMRHRIASLQRGERALPPAAPVFYVPGPERKLVQEGKPGALRVRGRHRRAARIADEETERACSRRTRAYLGMLDAGVAREVARGVLPVATYSSMYVT